MLEEAQVALYSHPELLILPRYLHFHCRRRLQSGLARRLDILQPQGGCAMSKKLLQVEHLSIALKNPYQDLVKDISFSLEEAGARYPFRPIRKAEKR